MDGCVGDGGVLLGLRLRVFHGFHFLRMGLFLVRIHRKYLILLVRFVGGIL